MFRLNNGHQQERQFELSPELEKRLLNSWAPLFYEHVFRKIDEAPFAVLYSGDNGRPNFPINILLSLEFYKHWRNLTDEELFDQAYFNDQVKYAIGLGQNDYVAERTLYEFRARVYHHLLNNPVSGDLIFGQFDNLTNHFSEVTGAKSDEQRADSTFLVSNMQRMLRVALIFDVLFHAVEGCDEQFLSDALKEILKPSYKNNVIYRTRSSSALERISEFLNLGQQLLDSKKANPQIADCKSFDLLERLLPEQGTWNEEKQKWDAKKSSDIKPDSLQSAHDPDATYRRKGNRNSVGYVANLTETCNKENEAQFITDYVVEVNTTADVDMLNDRLADIKERTDLKNMFVDGGYYGETVEQTAKELEVEMHYSSLTGKDANPDRLSLADFEIEDHKIIKGCPADQKPDRAAFNEKDHTLSAHFNLETCKNCPYFEKCPVKLQKKSAVIRVNQKTVLADETRQKLENGGQQENTSRRTAIEGTNSALKRSQGLGNLAVRGKYKVRVVVGLKIIGHNFQQFMAYLIRKAKTTIKEAKAASPGTPCQGVSLSF